MFNSMRAAWRNILFFLILLENGSAWATNPSSPSKTLDSMNNSDPASGKKLGAITGNLKEASNDIYDLLLTVAALVGFLIVGYSLYQLYKSSKDEREKPASAIVGLFIGGAMLGISTITVVMRNTVTG